MHFRPFSKACTCTVWQCRQVAVLREESNRQDYTSTNFVFFWDKLFRLILSDSSNKQLPQILINSNTAVRISNQHYFYIKTNYCIKFILLCNDILLYMFRTVFSSVIRIMSSKLYIQQQAFVKQILLSASSSSICLTNACRCMYSFELIILMTDGKTVRNIYSRMSF